MSRLIDRDNNTVVVYSDPKDGRYRQTVSYPWGTTVELPPPVTITLDTEELNEYADRNAEGGTPRFREVPPSV
ncbi:MULTISPECIES: hypothetical protein [unclassified Streptomyces]|uniref:hypothetical protein n=1 Tax=unclassified Streptomyces TaxID=2593676 RepID=UPI0037FE86E0